MSSIGVVNNCKIKCIRFCLKSLKLINKFKEPRTRISESSNSWEKLFGVPQGSMVGPSLFNISLRDLFLDVNKIDMESYADCNNLYKACVNIDAVIETVISGEKGFKPFQGFYDNQIKGNKGKCYLTLRKCDSNKPKL